MWSRCCFAHRTNDIVHSLGRSSYCAFFFALSWPPDTRRDLGCYLYYSEKILTHPTPPGLTELQTRSPEGSREGPQDVIIQVFSLIQLPS